MKKYKEQNSIKHLRHRVLKECTQVMRFPMLLNTITEILTSTLLVVTANTLGQFVDATFNLNLVLGLENAIVLTTCVLLTVIVAPIFGLLGDFSMLKRALMHDNVIFDRYFDKEPEKAMALNSGELQYELEDAPNELRIKWVIILSKALALPICSGYLLFCAGGISWLLTGIMLLLAAARLIAPMLFRTKLAKYDVYEKTYLAKRRSYEVDVTSNPHVIKLWGIRIPIQERFDHLFKKYYAETGAKYDTCKTFAAQLQKFVNDFTQILLFVVGAIMVAKGHVNPGEFASMLVYLSVTQTLLENMGDIIQNYPLMINAANRVSEFYSDPEVASDKLITSFTGLDGNRIDLSFGDKKVIDNLSFEIAQGEKAAIIGENGSGKSTLGKIIASLIRNYGGVVTVDGDDLKSVDVGTWRKIIAYAPQTPYLFDATVRENASMGNSTADKETVDGLLSAFGILPLADRTASMDSSLSGGERQKISIIRALLKNADLLILDEPTNHLDQESIDVLKGYIESTDRTVVAISHNEELMEVMKRKVVV